MRHGLKMKEKKYFLEFISFYKYQTNFPAFATEFDALVVKVPRKYAPQPRKLMGS